MERVDYIVDTNILIYVWGGDANVIGLMKAFDGKFCISIISYVEFMIVFKGESSFAESYLNSFVHIPLSKKVASAMVKIEKESNFKLGKLTAVDTIISATAIALDIPPIANNPSDFKYFSGIELITP